MATGDLDGNLNRLLQELRLVRFPVDVDEVGLRLGDPVVALQILHYILLDYSTEIAQILLQHGFELRGKTDQRFIEAACRVFRDVLEIRPVLTSSQILQQGFAERKLILLSTVIQKCRSLHAKQTKQKKLQSLKTHHRKVRNDASSIPSAPRIERAFGDVEPLKLSTSRWINATDVQEIDHHGDRAESFVETAIPTSEQDCSTSIFDSENFTCAFVHSTDASSPLQEQRQIESAISTKSNGEAANARSEQGAPPSALKHLDPWIREDCTRCEPSHLAARDSSRIRPQQRAPRNRDRREQTETLSNARSMLIPHGLEQRAVSVLQAQIRSMEECISRLAANIKSLQEERRSTQGAAQESLDQRNVSRDELSMRLARLETRVKFLEAEDRQRPTIPPLQKTSTDAVVPLSIDRMPRSVSPSRGIEASTTKGIVDGIIAELTQRQGTAETFLKEQKRRKQVLNALP